MRRLLLAALIATSLVSPVAPPAIAKTAGHPADPDYPAGLTVRRAVQGAIFADARGMTVYALNRRLARARSGAELNFCIGPCQQQWAPLAAPADAKPVGRWQVVKGAEGPQWSYKNDLVFTYRADRRPGSTAGDGLVDLWSVIAYVPPAPTLVAPAGVVPHYTTGAYVLTTADGHALFTGKATGAWQPLAAGMAARNLGGWSVIGASGQSQWAYRGRPVFVSQGDDPALIPAGATPLRP